MAASFRIFLSHATSDKLKVRKIRERLLALGHFVWIDEEYIRVGESIPRKVSDAIRDSDIFCLCISQASMKSKWVDIELDAFLHNKVGQTILVCKLDDAEPPTLISQLKYADFTRSFEGGLGSLTDALLALVEPHLDAPKAMGALTDQAKTVHDSIEWNAEAINALLRSSACLSDLHFKEFQILSALASADKYRGSLEGLISIMVAAVCETVDGTCSVLNALTGCECAVTVRLLNFSGKCVEKIGEAKLITLFRDSISQPERYSSDSRLSLVRENTATEDVLLGGISFWACDDLREAVDKYKDKSPQWYRHYNSLAVVPLRDLESGHAVGLLSADSLAGRLSNDACVSLLRNTGIRLAAMLKKIQQMENMRAKAE